MSNGSMSGDFHRLSIEAGLDEDSLLAVEPEVQDTEGGNLSHTEVENGTIVAETDDLVSIRASLNGWVRLVKVAEEVGTKGTPSD